MRSHAVEGSFVEGGRAGGRGIVIAADTATFTSSGLLRIDLD